MNRAVLLLLIAVSIMAGCATAGYVVSNKGWEAKWAKRDAADATAAAKAEKERSRILQQGAEELAKADADYQTKLKEQKSRADNTITEYRTGAIKLRKTLDCTVRAVSGTSSASALGDAASKCGLSAGDVEFLIRHAERADKVAEQLTAAQGVIRKYYALINGKELPHD